MDQTLYTQQGTKYVLRSITTAIPLVVASPASVLATVAINNTSPLIADTGGLSYNTTKPFIPLSYSFSAVDSINFKVVADFNSCYYSVVSGGSSAAYRNPLSKAIPYIQRNYYTDSLNSNFMCQYNQILFSDDDFMQAVPQTEVLFVSSIAEAMTGIVLDNSQGTLPVGTYLIGMSFLFCELNP